MCRKCVREELPTRGSSTFDTGAYFLNYKGCAECSSMTLKQTKRKVTDEDDVEEIIFTHSCSECDHEVCSHRYTFEVVEEYQEYGMECLLCGIGSASVSVMPVDPRKESVLY